MKSVVYLGIPGSYSYAAAQALFKADDAYIGVSAFKDICTKVLQQQADYGVIPIENSLAGSIYDVYDLLGMTEGVVVIGEHYARIQHTLQVSPVVAQGKASAVVLAAVREVYSHPKALEQCPTLFQQYPHMRQKPYSDTATAARLVAERRDPTIAAIASRQAAAQYGLKIMTECAEGAAGNYTRFLIIGHTQPVPLAGSVNDKCSVQCQLPHRPGALRDFLTVLAEQNCNITMLESRPLPGKPFEYAFYVDFSFTVQIEAIATVIDELKKRSKQLRVLGIYQNQIGSVA